MIKGMFSKIFGKAVETRNQRYDKEKEEIIKIDIPVISVGNLTVGGTGKTPFVQMLARDLQKIKRKPAIIGRGYKKKSKGEIILCDGKNILADAREGGDEMFMLADTLRIPVIAHESKSEAAKNITSKFDVDTVIIDDGFQHRRLHRDIDIVLIDNDTIENPDLLPKGRLREPLESIGRADIICLTGNITPNEKIAALKDTKLTIRVIPWQERPYHIKSRQQTGRYEYRDMLSGIVCVAGIAKPERFRNMLEKQKYSVKQSLDYPDHHYYNEKDVEKIIQTCRDEGSDYIATTEKDAAKLINLSDMFANAGIHCYVFPITLRIIEGRNAYFSKLKSLYDIERNEKDSKKS
ncbi:MAG: tetraacyldisaccharide 4'-kinase [Candidatus Kapaibacterium sp.]